VSGTLVPARGQGHSSFVNSVLTAVENIYTDVVQPSSHGTLLPQSQGRRATPDRRTRPRGGRQPRTRRHPPSI